MAKARGLKIHESDQSDPSVRSKAQPVHDRYLLCPGSGIVHPQAFVQLMQGAKVKFVRCPIQTCQANLFLNGHGWAGDVGVSKAEIERRNPEALIL